MSRTTTIIITLVAAVVATGLAVALGLLVVAPTLRNTCTWLDKRCVTIKYRKTPSGQLWVQDPITNLAYWYDGTMIRSYGVTLPGQCPPEIVQNAAGLQPVGPARRVCRRWTPNGTCANWDVVPTVPEVGSGTTVSRNTGVAVLEPTFVMNAYRLQGAAQQVACSRARNVVEAAFATTPIQTVKVPAPSSTLTVTQLFEALEGVGVFVPPATDPEPPECSGHGTRDPTTTECKCDPGWLGATCATPVCNTAADCNNGRCAGGLCVCDPGWTGDACTLKQCVDGCNPATGTCDPTTGTCVCNSGWTGPTCSTPTCPPCDRGTCDPAIGICVCEPGWTGAACNRRACPAACSGNGWCDVRTGICACTPEWTGAACDVPVCPNNCNRRGVCDTFTKQCVCDPGWIGDQCEQSVCPGAGCCAHGTCDPATATCTCNPGWSGDACDQPDDPTDAAVCPTRTM